MANCIPVRKLFLIFLLSTLAISTATGCSKTPPAEVVEQDLPLSTATIPAPQAPDRAVLAASANTDAALLAEAQSVIAALAAENGLLFETRETIFSNEITPDVKIIVFLDQPENLGSLAAGAPATQFVAIGSQDWNPPANGSIIRINPDHIAFLSGYLSAMLAPNFRVGALQVAEAGSFNQAFINGVSYYCGICAAQVYPLNTYPVIAQQPTGSPPANWQTAFNEVNVNKVNVLFLPGEAASAELGTFLAGQDVAIIGEAAPPEELRSKWAATVSSDGLSALREIWPDLISGNGGKTVNASLRISDMNYVAVTDGMVGITQGKMQQIYELIQLLRDGQIYPYPITQ